MTVWEHLIGGAAARRIAAARTAAGALGPTARRAARAEEVLEFFGLEKYRDALARTLPYGIQRKVEMARALTAGPKLLLLDEPVAGMNHDEADDLRTLMLRLSAARLEHPADRARHGVRDESLPRALRAGFRRHDRRRPAGRDPRQPGGPRRLSRERGRHADVRNLEVLYGPIRAVRGIDLDVNAGEIVALIGANGAGKTTTVRAIAGLTAVSRRNRLWGPQASAQQGRAQSSRRYCAGAGRPRHSRPHERRRKPADGALCRVRPCRRACRHRPDV